jgi:acyl carrier protein
MTETEIYFNLTVLFRELFADDRLVIQATTSARDIDDWDSFNHLNLMVGAQDRFGVKFQTREIDGLVNVADLVALIKRKLDTR